MNKNKFTVIGIVLTTVILAGVAIFTAIRLYQTRTGPVAPNAPSSKPAAAGTVCGGIAGVMCPTGEECIYSNGTKVAPYADASGTCQVIDNSKNACSLSFTLATTTPTATPTRTPTATPTVTATPVPQCNSVCSTTSNCPSGLTCYKPNGATTGNCRNTQCTTAANCVCATSTPTATPTKTATPTATATSTATTTATATANLQCNSSCTSNSNCPPSMICYIPSGSTVGNCRNTQCLSETDCACAVTTSTPTYVATASDQPTLPEVGTTWPTLLGTGFGILVIIGSLLLAL